MSLTWRTAKPMAPGWYWVRTVQGESKCVEISAKWDGRRFVDRFTPIGVTTYTHWAGPIARPVEPKPSSLALVRYKLEGTYSDPRRYYYYWGSYDWDFFPRAEMLRMAKVRLCGDAHYYNQPVEADSSEVVLFTNRRQGNRWPRRSEREVFTAATIDAVIAQCAQQNAGRTAA